jgi:hypothetical protein
MKSAKDGGRDAERHADQQGSDQTRPTRHRNGVDILEIRNGKIVRETVYVAEAFDADPDDVRRELGPNLLTVPSFTVFIGYLADEPVATAMLGPTPGVTHQAVEAVRRWWQQRAQGKARDHDVGG